MKTIQIYRQVSSYAPLLLFTVLGILVSHVSLGQEIKYIPGFIIQINGDTVHGYIGYRGWDENPKKISFKEHPDSEGTKYTPIDIRSFGVMDEIYESGLVEIEVSPSSTSDLDLNAELEIKNDTVFLQTMIRGAKSLYYLNVDGKELFYISRDGRFELLVYKRYLKEIDGQSLIMQNKRFIGQLLVYLQDCPSIQSKSDNISYSKKNLEGLYLYYYNCTGATIGFQKKTEKLPTEFGVLAGMSITSLKFSSEYYTYLVDVDYPPSLNVSAGLFFNIFLSKKQGRWALCNDLIYTGYNVEARYEDYYSEEKYTIIDTEIGYSYIKLTDMVHFQYPFGPVFLFLNAGVSNAFAVNETNYKKTESKFYSQYTVKEELAINDTRKHELGYMASLGIKYKKFLFETRYEAGNGMSKYTTLASNTSRLYFLFGYRF